MASFAIAVDQIHLLSQKTVAPHSGTDTAENSVVDWRLKLPPLYGSSHGSRSPSSSRVTVYKHSICKANLHHEFRPGQSAQATAMALDPRRPRLPNAKSRGVPGDPLLDVGLAGGRRADR